MTAEELALLGYPSPQAQAQDSYTQQPTPDDLARMGSGPGVGYPMGVMQGGPDPTIEQFSPQSAAGPQMDPQTLAMLANSDPNGFTSGPAGPPPLPLPGNPGEAMATPGSVGVSGNPATNPYTPNGTADRQPQRQEQVQPQYSEFDKFMIETGRANVDLTPAERLQAHKAYDAIMLKRMEMNDPEKQLKLQKDRVELQKSTMEQADAVAKKADAIPQVEENIRLLDELTSQKGLPYAVGTGRFSAGAYLYGMRKEPIPGSVEADFMARLDQVQGKNFLTAFNQLRGAGQITELEGAKAQDALGRLKTTQSEGAFRQSVAELRGILQAGLDRSKARLGTQAPSDTATTAPSPSPATAPVIKTIPGRGTFQSLGNGQWKQIQ